MNILVINAGSSSLKYQLMNPDTGDVTAKGLCERIGLDGRLTHKVPATGKKVEKDIPMPTHKEAIEAVRQGTFSEEKVADWNTRLATVFNRGFWDGYYLGQRLGEWSQVYGSSATEKKQYVGKGMKYFSRLGVGEFYIEAGSFSVGDRLLIVGPTTGALYVEATDIHGDSGPVSEAVKGMRVSIPVPEKVRPSDKLYKVVTNKA